MKRLNVEEYNHHTPYRNDFSTPSQVKIYLKQHVGASAKLIVKVGEKITKGDLIGKMEEGKLGANIHASISGVVEEVNNEISVLPPIQKSNVFRKKSFSRQVENFQIIQRKICVTFYPFS